jgi:DNA adenine methylase
MATVESLECDEITERLTAPLKWWGGKHYMAQHIIGLMPAHLHYVEPFAGGLAVLLEKNPRGVSEVVNDLNRELTNFWRVLQREDTYAAFQRLVEATPFSEVEWEEADARQHPIKDCDVEAAVAFFIRCRQSRAGGFRDFATLSRNRTRRQMNEQTSAWLTAIDGLPAVAARLRRVVILNESAIEVIRREDGENTLFYLDPPYLHETRTAIATYKHEMTEDDHRELLTTIKQCQGKVVLSGYPSQLYDKELARWRRLDFQIDNKAAGGKTKREMTEAVWMNY